jgi:hypothetical protein
MPIELARYWADLPRADPCVVRVREWAVATRDQAESAAGHWADPDPTGHMDVSVAHQVSQLCAEFHCSFASAFVEQWICQEGFKRSGS